MKAAIQTPLAAAIVLLSCLFFAEKATASLIDASVTFQRIASGFPILVDQTQTITDGLGPEFSDTSTPTLLMFADVQQSSIDINFGGIGYLETAPINQHYLFSGLNWTNDPLATIDNISVTFGGTINQTTAAVPFSSSNVVFFGNSIRVFVGGYFFSGGSEASFIHIDITPSHDLTPIPLPAALPLFAGGIGLLGLLGWRRKRAVAAA